MTVGLTVPGNFAFGSDLSAGDRGVDVLGFSWIIGSEETGRGLWIASTVVTSGSPTEASSWKETVVSAGGATVTGIVGAVDNAAGLDCDFVGIAIAEQFT